MPSLRCATCMKEWRDNHGYCERLREPDKKGLEST